MTEKRKPEDTVCPTIFAALIAAPDWTRKEIEDKRMAACLGLDCQMFNASFRGCGLRYK